LRTPLPRLQHAPLGARAGAGLARAQGRRSREKQIPVSSATVWLFLLSPIGFDR
jgi:hypothetical protein